MYKRSQLLEMSKSGGNNAEKCYITEYDSLYDMIIQYKHYVSIM